MVCLCVFVSAFTLLLFHLPPPVVTRLIHIRGSGCLNVNLYVYVYIYVLVYWVIVAVVTALLDKLGPCPYAHGPSCKSPKVQFNRTGGYQSQYPEVEQKKDGALNMTPALASIRSGLALRKRRHKRSCDGDRGSASPRVHKTSIQNNASWRSPLQGSRSTSRIKAKRTKLRAKMGQTGNAKPSSNTTSPSKPTRNPSESRESLRLSQPRPRRESRPMIVYPGAGGAAFEEGPTTSFLDNGNSWSVLRCFSSTLYRVQTRLVHDPHGRIRSIKTARKIPAPVQDFHTPLAGTWGAHDLLARTARSVVAQWSAPS